LKYEIEVIIDAPPSKVVELMDNPDNMKHWQPGLTGYELLDSEPDQPSAKIRLDYDMNGRKMSLVETIEKNKLPDYFSGIYECDGVWNRVENWFEEVDENATSWRSNVEFRFETFGMKLMGFFMPFAFKKQSLKFMENFKKFVETQ